MKAAIKKLWSTINLMPIVARESATKAFGKKTGKVVYRIASVADWFTPGPCFSVAVIVITGPIASVKSVKEALNLVPNC